jgi:cellulose biosynthesis protein BcsQ
MRPLIVSFVSGKGGVGKTMLAVAFARQLSRKGKTLLLDLDFFNRGLTGLLRRGREVCKLREHGIFGSARGDGFEESWSLIEVGDNLLHVSYPDLSQDQLRRLETSGVSELTPGLCEFLAYLAEKSGCEAIVLDCHGGPDNLSFAACQVSDYSLLVSEPDKITFYGTLHFVRQPVAKADLRLIFNKVVPAFSVQYLTAFYNSNLRQLFGGHPLLAIFPMELYLTKEFEKTPFLIDVYPFSMLTRKTELMVVALLEERKLGGADRFLPRLLWPSKIYARLSMGKTPWLLNVNFVMAVIAIAAVAIYLFALSSEAPLATVSRRLGAQVDRADLLLQFQKHPNTVPPECQSWEASAQPDCFSVVYVRDLAEWQKLSCWDVRESKPACGNLQAVVDTGRIYPFLLHNAGAQNQQPWFLLSELNTLQTTQGLSGAAASAVKGIATPSLWFRLLASVSALLDQYTGFLAGAGAFWFLVAVILSWSAALDVSFTYCLRRRSQLMSAVLYLTALSLWAIPLFFYGVVSREVKEVQIRVVLLLLLIPLLSVVINQSWKAFLDVWSERRRGEGALRIIFVVYVVAVPIIGRFSK